MTVLKFDNSYARLPEHFFARQNPDISPDPTLISFNGELAETLGFAPDFFTSKDGLAMVSGQSVMEGSDPIAMAYAGHQFGGWSPRLGDGRALLLGEVIGSDGIRYDIQLKGSGRTIFSRGGDGKAALGPVIREYVMSEAMAALGVPTTRALAAVTTGEDVVRQTILPGGIVTRVAKSHIRVGTFQYFASLDDTDAVQKLAEYVINRNYPEAQQTEHPIESMFRSIVMAQANLIPLWLKYGFIHGVMNTDNMQIAGETIDFGPCAFMDDFEALKVFSSIDQNARYAWARQASMASWNLTRLAETLLPIWGVNEETAIESAKKILEEFGNIFEKQFQVCFSHKLGLLEDHEGNSAFIQETLQKMQEQKVDFTLFFSYLRRINQVGYEDKFLGVFEDEKAGEAWLETWREFRKENGISEGDSQGLMDVSNPIYIPRNHRIEQVIVAGVQGDYDPMYRLMEVLKNPMQEQSGKEEYENPPTSNQIVTQTFCGT